MMPLGFTTNTVRQPPLRGRRCGLWISPYVPVGRPVILDTAALEGDRWAQIAGDDTFPDDCLLVVMYPRDELTLIANATVDALAVLTGPVIAEILIEKQCALEPELRARLRW